MITSIVENYQKSNRLPIKNMFFNKKKEVKNAVEDNSSKDLAIVTQMNQEFAKSLDLKETLNNSKIDLFFLQGTVVSTEHIGMEGKETLNIKDLCQSMKVPVIAGNCVTYEVAKLLMEEGVAGLMVGIGPGAACTSRGVLGIGIPQATAIADCSSARDDYFKESGNYIPIIGDGGIVCLLYTSPSPRDS